MPSPVPDRTFHRVVVPASIALLCLIWGSTWWAIRVCLVHDGQPPLTSAALRFALAAAVMAVLALALRTTDRAPPPPPWLWIVAAGTNFAGAYGLLYVGELHVPSGVAAVLWAIFPLLMAGSGAAFLGERLRLLQALGFVVAFAGVVVVFAGDLGGSGAVPVTSAALVLASPCLSATGTTLIKKFGAGTSSVLLNRNGMLLGGVLLAAAAFVVEDPTTMPWTLPGGLAIAYLSLIGTALSFGLYFWLLQRTPASRLSLVSYVTPVLAVLLGALVGDGETTAAVWAGTALVVTGVALVVTRWKR